MSTKTACKAKNPKTCRYHSKISKETISSNKTQVEQVDLFASAIARNPRLAAMEAQINWAKKKREELQKRYTFFQPKIETEYKPIHFGDPRLHALNDEYKALESKATPEELEALKDFTGLGYLSTNRYLTDPDKQLQKVQDYLNKSGDSTRLETIIQKEKDAVKNLDSVITKAGETEQPRTLYRVLSQDSTEKFTSSEEYANNCGFIVGKEVEFKGYSSTTIDPAFITRFVSKEDEHTSVVLVISTTRGAPVSSTATKQEEIKFTQDSEHEILLPRDTRYKVTKVTRAKFSHHDDWYEPVTPTTVYLEEVRVTTE